MGCRHNLKGYACAQCEEENRIAELEAENASNRVLVDCLPILIGRLKELGEHGTLTKWDRARAALQGKNDESGV